MTKKHSSKRTPKREEREPKSKKSTKTIALIKSAGLECFSSMGYSATSVQDIVEIADVTKPTLYYYFPTKAELFVSLIEQAQREMKTVVEPVFGKENNSPKEVLTNYIMAMSKLVKERKDIVRLIHYAFFAAEKEIPNRGKCFQEAHKFIDMFEAYFKKVISEGKLSSKYTVQDLSTMFMGISAHLSATQLVKQESLISAKRAELIVEIFLMGAQSRN